VDGSTERRREVDPRVEAVAARAESVAQGSTPDGPVEGKPHPWDPGTKSVQRRATGDPVWLYVREALKTMHGRLHVRPETTVERAVREAVPGETELEGRDVPADGPLSQDARSEPPTPEATKRASCGGADDAVDDEVMTALEAPNGCRRQRPSDTVDRPGVDAACVEGHLEGGDTGVPGCARTAGEGEGGDGEGQSDERSRSHGQRYRHRSGIP
jgi:hypothetical protein